MNFFRFALIGLLAFYTPSVACEEAGGEQFQFQADVNKLMVRASR